MELTIRDLYDRLPVRSVAPCVGLEVRRTGQFISVARLAFDLEEAFEAGNAELYSQRIKKPLGAERVGNEREISWGEFQRWLGDYRWIDLVQHVSASPWGWLGLELLAHAVPVLKKSAGPPKSRNRKTLPT